MKQKGFILMIMLFLLLLLAVTSISLNMKTGMQAKIAVNQSLDVQSYFSQLAVIEQSVWKLAEDPSWRVPAGENMTYPDPAVEADPQKRITYSRKVFSPDAATYPALDSYRDAVIFSVRLPNASTPVNESFRYTIDTPIVIKKPRQVSLDNTGNIFFADVENHSIWKIDAISGAILRAAGTGASGYSGDGGSATGAKLDSPRGVWADGMGNLYISDTNNNCIRKVTAGIIRTVVNTSTNSGFSGDGGAATAARLDSPNNIVVDASGNIYIADRVNNRIRKVTVATGIITTVAGSSAVGGFSGDGNQATAALLDNPRGVYCNAACDDIFIADTANNRIRKVKAATGIITTVAGGGGSLGDGGQATTAQLNKPRSVYLDAAGNIFIADTDNSRIRKVVQTSGVITTIVNTSGIAGYSGDGGAATAARIDNPAALVVNTTGEVIISDTNNGCLRQVATGGAITTLSMTAGPGLNDAKKISPYYDATLKKLFLYIADRDNHRIRKLDTETNTITTVAGTGSAGFSGDDGLAVNAKLFNPEGIATSYDATQSRLFLYIADTDNNRIRKVDTTTGIITTVAGGGGSLGDGGLATSAQFSTPRGLAVDASGNIFIADTNNHRIRKFAVGGNISTVAGTGVADYNNEGTATVKRINFPQGVWAHTSGDIYIADTNNHRIRKFTVGGNISTVAGTLFSGYWGDGGNATAAWLNYPQDVSVDTAGNIYIADTNNHRLRLVNINDGTIRTMAGTGTGGYNGDLQPAIQARLRSPAGIALGLAKGAGRIFISDSGNDRIRVLFLKTVKELYGP